ncbi:hypothetical protein QN277_020579 [Acacia crassicarpa]|uniref:Uncharacterized protein n=1 Tax=Acacia crassicarpa TaxID=499986 RepID=A0AAE1JK05_9FABA|nr:hypothetical protein QN277_020579 [Acacia crassicarpa]
MKDAASISAMTNIVFPCQTYLCYSPSIWAPEITTKTTTQVIRAQQGQERRRQKPFVSSSSSSSRHWVINNQKAVTFTYNLSDNLHLHHLPGVPANCFEEHMEDMGRVVGAIIPEKSSAVRLNQEEWRVKMAGMEALFLKVQPVIDVRVTAKSNGQDYPPHVPPHTPKLYQFHATKWKLQGLHSDYMPPFFNLEASGTLYPQTRGTRGCVIKNQLNADVTIVYPQLLSWVPQHVLDSIMLSILRTVVEDIRKAYKVRLVADYTSFQRSKLKTLE